VPVAPSYVTVILVTPAFTPTNRPDLLTVAVFALSVDHDASEVTSRFVPSGIVALAVSCLLFAWPTTQGDGDNSMAETFADGVDVPPHAVARAANVQETAIPAFITSPVPFSPEARRAARTPGPCTSWALLAPVKLRSTHSAHLGFAECIRNRPRPARGAAVPLCATSLVHGLRPTWAMRQIQLAGAPEQTLLGGDVGLKIFPTEHIEIRPYGFAGDAISSAGNKGFAVAPGGLLAYHFGPMYVDADAQYMVTPAPKVFLLMGGAGLGF
jgi:hypothetical protein